MNIVSYERFDRDGIELVINTATGESFATQAGYIRMSGAPKSTVSSRMQGVRKDEFQEAEVLTPGGLQGVRLVDEDTIADWLEKDNPTLLKKFSKLGIRISLHKLAGYEVTSTAIAKAPVQNRALEASRQVKEIHENVVDISPRLAQFLIDTCVNDLIGNQLPGDAPQLRGVAEIAKEMGFPVNEKNRGNLGRFVKAQLRHLFQTEKRLCNGVMADVAAYPDTPEVRARIAEFFA